MEREDTGADDALTAKQVAALVGCAPTLLYKLVAEGTIKASKVRGADRGPQQRTCWMFARADLDLIGELAKSHKINWRPAGGYVTISEAARLCEVDRVDVMAWIRACAVDTYPRKENTHSGWWIDILSLLRHYDSLNRKREADNQIKKCRTTIRIKRK